MKIEALLEGIWIIKNKAGFTKRFKDDKSPEAVAWAASSEDPHRERKDKANARSQEKRDRDRENLEWEVRNGYAHAPKHWKAKPDAIYMHFSTHFGDTFPDVDYADTRDAREWMEDNYIDMDDVNAAFQKVEGKSYTQWAADFWDDHAKNAGVDPDEQENPFR